MKNIAILSISFLLLTGCLKKSENKQVEVVVKDTTSFKIDPLPSWNEGKTKAAIIDYINDVTNKESANFIPEIDRIATFDNDGNLWSEQPAYFQLFFAMDRVKELAKDHPEWQNKQPFKAVLENDMKTLIASGEKGIMELIMATHAGITTDEFELLVKNWLETAQHPRFNKPYNQLIYQPMLELLDYLRTNDFKTFIVSGGGIEFMRPWVEEAYGIPKDQVVGSSIATEYDYNNGAPVIRRLSKIDFIDDKAGKPVGINKFIGRKPVFASGNSDGDLQMMQWTDSNPYKSFQLYLHHTDADREWAYDRESHIGQFNKGLDEALEKGWTIIDMKNDWKTIYPFQKE
ncbi:MAG: haloacid dehalogenase [Xanthomarina sp.]|uniref:HAD family hydrolase n=1 Tax=Xanthomarina sp. TaxID=1931211 RepID=UPI000C4831FE|nr:HAD family hydrolase [Xanthomarina sp.]MAL24074.1 haloacid dehalogenase [Xanthomarina sp.]MBF61456.1 haloacid dehalogenase [Xanthomarina sp.]|tara:strand:+ start:1548 stop:2582 length:1035 start_codon:yes stop_codon:yes gene_type:complete